MRVDKSAPRIRRMFDHISPRYDALNHLFSLNQDVRWRRAAAEECPSRGVILDLCCGTADLALAIAARSRAAILGADFAIRMLRLGRTKSIGKSIRYVQADALSLPFVAGTFDAVTVAFGIRNMQDPACGLREMARVLKPGGRAVILEFTMPKSAGLRQLSILYAGGVMGALGDMLTGSRAYRYFCRSVQSWQDPDQFREQMLVCGFSRVERRPMTLGIVNLFVGAR